jgi:peptidoglycan/xylan/chitin deacetylase (PgdA/CDA1 family)
MRILKNWLKEGIFGTLYLCVQGNDKGIKAILLYHSVEKDVFSRQMFYLKDKFRFILLRDLQVELSRNNSEENLICCTFDDGRLNNYITALPILQEFGLKATFFIISGLVGKYISEPSGKTRMMSAPQLHELVSLGHEIGSHTVTHPVLTQIPLKDARYEISRSKLSLEDMIGSPVVSFAYPKGAFNQEIRHLVPEAGFENAVTIKEGLVNNKNMDWLLLPRLGIDENVRWIQFKGKVSRALEIYETLRGRRPRYR